MSADRSSGPHTQGDVQMVTLGIDTHKSQVGADGKILAGGQSLLPLLSLRLAHPSQVIDINPLHSEIGQIRADDGGVAIGAHDAPARR